MKAKYKIVPDLSSHKCLTLNPEAAKKENLSPHNKWFLRFGMQALEITVKTSPSLSANEIKLSIGIIDYLRVPLNSHFELLPKRNEILLGPFIGILTAAKKSTLDDTVQYLSNYVYDYNDIGGTVIAFSLEGMDPITQTIEGYLYNPESKQWDSGVFAYPASVFKIIYLDKEWRNHFQTVFGNNYFNSYVFNKWEMYKWLSQEPDLMKHLPYTLVYHSEQELDTILNQYNEIYVKPVHGSMGERIFKISKNGENDLHLVYRENGVPNEIHFTTFYDVGNFFKSQFKGKTFILQQALDLISFNEKKIDFRIVLVKNQAGNWEDMCMVGKYGQQGSIVTNILAGGSAEIGEITLKKVFGLSEQETFRLRSEISRISLDAARCIEESGVHCGNLGVDIAIDKSGKVWIIEINNLNPSPLFALDINDRQLFYQIKRLNMLYAKRLAGFCDE